MSKKNKIFVATFFLTVIVLPFVLMSNVFAAGVPYANPTGWSYGPIGGSPAVSAQSSGSGWNVPSASQFGLPGGTVSDIIMGILNWLLAILGVIGVIGFAISGIMYLISTGNDDMLKQAKSAMKYSIIGVIVGLSGVVAIKAVDALLRGSPSF